MLKALLIAIILTIASLPTSAQDMHYMHSPYAGEEKRDIPTLSSKQVQGYLYGTGAGLAKAAELNHYPGPRHALDLAKQLQLSKEQVDKLKSIYEKMHEAALPLGKQLVEKEKLLNSAFATQKIDESSLQSLVSQIAKVEGELRFVHLKAHVETQKILTPQQIAKYDQDRGYTISQ